MKPDAIFSLIEKSHLRERAISSLMKEHDRLERRLKTLGFSGRAQADHPLMKDYERRYESAERAAGRAMRAVCETAPTTMEGLSALITYLRPQMMWLFKGEFSDGRTDNLPDTLIKAVRGLTSSLAQKRADHHAIAAE